MVSGSLQQLDTLKFFKCISDLRSPFEVGLLNSLNVFGRAQ